MLCLPTLLLSASIAFESNSLWLYKYGFEKYGISQTTGLANSELDKVAIGLISYFKSDEENISLTVIKDGKPFELFTPEEIIHFKDVKGLIRLDYWLLLGTLIYTFGYGGASLFWHKRKYWRQLAWGVVGGGGITLALMLALGLGTFFGFDQLFYQFHLLFFSNEFWSAEGYMLMLFPEGFWYEATLFCALITSGLAIILGGVSGWYLWTTARAKSWENR